MRVTDANRIVWRDSLPLAIAMLNGQGGCLPHVEGDGYRWLEWLCQQILPEPVGFLEWNEKSGQMEIRPGKEKPYFDRLYGLKKGCWIPDGTSAQPAPENGFMPPFRRRMRGLRASALRPSGADAARSGPSLSGAGPFSWQAAVAHFGASAGGSAGYQSFLDALRPAALPGGAALAGQPPAGRTAFVPGLAGKLFA